MISGNCKDCKDRGSQYCICGMDEFILRAKKLDEMSEADSILHDAMGLLMNHEQHKDEGWQKDYEELVNKYSEHFSQQDIHETGD